MPNIYTYRRTAVIALISPLALFTLLFIPLLIWLHVSVPGFYLVAVIVFAIHIGGCVGDMYMLYLLFFKYKDKRLLMRDTGPEQFLYLPKD